MRGGLAIDSGIQCQDNLGHPVLGDPLYQRWNAQLIGADLIQRRERSPKHMITPLKRARAFHGPKVGHILDNAKLARNTGRIGADGADVRRADVAAPHTIARRQGHPRQGLG